AGKCTTKTMVEAVTDDFDLFVAGSLKFRPLFALDGLSTRVLLCPFAGKDPRVDHDAVGARWHLERAVSNIPCLLAEDGAQELLFRRKLCLAFGSDLPHQNITGADFRANADD